jgi:ADP-heptose:LPS heptosyltransferase
MNIYLKQTKGNELGNFVSLTSTIILLYEHFGVKIPIVFETNYVKELYCDWYIIECITEEEANNRKLELFETSTGEYRNSPDKEYIIKARRAINSLKLGKSTEIPMPYVPDRNLPLMGDYVVVVRGCIDHHKPVWSDAKEVGDEIFEYIFSKLDLPVVFVGNTTDYNRSYYRMEKMYEDTICVLDDINKVVGVVNGCKYMISNDTGLHHVASALGKEVFVLWKDTPFAKNSAPGEKCFFSKKGEWYRDFEQWTRSYKCRTDM